MDMHEVLMAQNLGRNEAERYEMMTGRRAPWVKRHDRHSETKAERE